ARLQWDTRPVPREQIELVRRMYELVIGVMSTGREGPHSTSSPTESSPHSNRQGTPPAAKTSCFGAAPGSLTSTWQRDLVEQERDDLRGALHLGLDRDDRGAADDRVVVDEPLGYAHDRIRERADVGPRLERAALLLLAIQLGKLPDRAALHAAIA